MARAPLLQDPDFALYVGDVREVLAELPDRSVDCCVTSPPYWALRDYGADGQIGLEQTPADYVAEMVAVFREVRRVLADHGTLWLNLGDSYSQDTKWGGRSGNKNELEQGYPRPTERGRSGVKPKDLVGIPWRVAFALQDDGWHLRSDCIWAKPNPMPESVTDRPTKAHEYVFMLTKRARYYFDQEAVREPFTTDDANRATLNGGSYSPPGQAPHGNARQETLDPSLQPEAPRGPDGRRQTTIRGATPGEGSHENHAAREGAERWPNDEGRNLRTVWEIATQPYTGAHFATFPRELPRRCIRASAPERVCRTCGKPSERIVERTPMVIARSDRTHEKGQTRSSGTMLEPATSETVGWSDCGHGAWRPGVVLDPFLGAGTTALVAREQGRRCVGIELNPEYAQLAATRLQQLSLLA